VSGLLVIRNTLGANDTSRSTTILFGGPMIRTTTLLFIAIVLAGGQSAPPMPSDLRVIPPSAQT